MSKFDLPKAGLILLGLLAVMATPSFANLLKIQPSERAREPFIDSHVSIEKSGQVKISTTLCNTRFFEPQFVNKYVGILSLRDKNDNIITSLHLRTKTWHGACFRAYHPGTFSQCTILTSHAQIPEVVVSSIKRAQYKPTLALPKTLKKINHNTLKLEFLP